MVSRPQFKIVPSPSCIKGRCRYIAEDYAFNFLIDPNQQERFGHQSTTSFAVDTLQLEVSIESLFCLYLSGYSPLGNWKRTSLCPPKAKPGSLRAIYNSQLHPAIVIGIEDIDPTAAWLDPNSGWFCLGIKETPKEADSVEFATGCLAVVIDRQLFSLWIQPENWKELL